MATPAIQQKDPTIYDLYHEIGKDDKPTVSPSEVEMVRRVLSSLQIHEKKRLTSGFNEHNFTIGVLNTILITYVFGAHPEHFWLLFLVEASVLVPLKMWQDYKARPLCQVLYYLDYCWMMNFLSTAALYVLVFFGDSVDTNVRIQLLMLAVGVGCGSLLGATAILPFVATVFHDSKTMTSLFIHIIPPMVLYTFLWHGDDIRGAWPDIFQLPYHLFELDFFPDASVGYGPFFLPWKGIGTVSGNAMSVYFAWWILYSLWMVVIGLELTRTKTTSDVDGTIKTIQPKYDTVYFSMVRDGYSMAVGGLWGRKKEVSKRFKTEGDYEYRDFFLYMTIHASLIFFSTNVLAYACLQSKMIHATFIWMLVVICVFRGSKRYVFWVTSSSSRALQKEYLDILEGSHIKKA